MTFIWLIHCITSSLIINASLTNMSYSKLKRFHRLIIFLFSVIILFILPHSMEGSWSNIIIFCCAYFFLLYLQMHPLLNLVGIVLNYIIAVCINYLLLALISIAGIDSSTIFTSLLYDFIFCSIQAIIMNLITGSIGNYYRKLLTTRILPLLQDSFHKKIFYLFSLEVISCGAVFVFNVIAGNYVGYSQSVLLFNGVLFLILSVSTFIIIFYLYRTIRTDYELRLKMAETEKLTEYTTRLEGLYQEIRGFKHDYINILSSLYSYMEEQRYEEMRMYLEKHILPAGSALAKEDTAIGKLSNLKILEIKGILYTKILKASCSSLQITADIPYEISALSMDIPDLVKILGILLDNAIEAAEATDTKELYIGIMKQNGWCYIRIANSTLTIQNISALYDSDYSEKKGHMGIGLYEVKQVLQTYENVLLNSEYQDHTFIQLLSIRDMEGKHVTDHHLRR